MSLRTRYAEILLAGVLAAAIVLAGSAQAQVPNLVNYQGLVSVSGTGFTGSGQFRFALVDAAGTTTFWSNDGTSIGGSQPTNAVTLNVASGIFTVSLGDTTLANMTSIPATVFTSHGDVRLRVWFSDGTHGIQQLAPDQRVVAVGYAIRAGSADALATGASVPAVQISGTLATGQLADGSVTKPKLSAAGGSAGQVLGTDGANLQWQGAGGAGTVTQVNTGTGLTGGPITASGTVSIANGGVGATQLAGGAVDVSKLNTTSTDGRYFRQGGNAFGGVATLGTTDNNALEFAVNGIRVMRYEPNTFTPNVIGGHVNNGVYIGVFGASIGGGGAAGAQGSLLLGYSCILGYGCLNGVTDAWGTIGGGAGNQAGDGVGVTSDTPFATVSGGFSNWALEQFSSVGGGLRNAATGAFATVAGGADNTASGLGATVPGGTDNTAAGVYSFAAGGGAKIPASAPGTFFWNDAQGGQTLPEGAHDQFIVIATNGIGMYTYKDFSHGCVLIGGAGSWSCTSDRATKTDFASIEPREILARVVAMPITQWRWKGEAETVRHIGPMAQDFRAAFGLGYDDKTIALVDNEGVALAAIQGLNAKLERQVARQEEEIEELRRHVHELESRAEQVSAAAHLVEPVLHASIVSGAAP